MSDCPIADSVLCPMILQFCFHVSYNNLTKLEKETTSRKNYVKYMTGADTDIDLL